VILCFSGHKICGPTGDFIRKESLNKLPAYQGGGEMIKDVSLRKLLMLTAINLKPERRMLLVESF
jgi:selenocysteine lyase/cysteine desulfurase